MQHRRSKNRHMITIPLNFNLIGVASVVTNMPSSSSFRVIITSLFSVGFCGMIIPFEELQFFPRIFMAHTTIAYAAFLPSTFNRSSNTSLWPIMICFSSGCNESGLISQDSVGQDLIMIKMVSSGRLSVVFQDQVTFSCSSIVFTRVRLLIDGARGITVQEIKSMFINIPELEFFLE